MTIVVRRTTVLLRTGKHECTRTIESVTNGRLWALRSMAGACSPQVLAGSKITLPVRSETDGCELRAVDARQTIAEPIVARSGLIGGEQQQNPSLPAPDFSFYGDTTGALVGHTLAVADVNGDGASDIFTSSPGAPQGGAEGSVSLILGGPALPGFERLESIEVFRGYGPASRGFAGYPFQGLALGDLDADGYRDVCFAAETGGAPASAGAAFCRDVFAACAP